MQLDRNGGKMNSTLREFESRRRQDVCRGIHFAGTRPRVTLPKTQFALEQCRVVSGLSKPAVRPSPFTSVNPLHTEKAARHFRLPFLEALHYVPVPRKLPRNNYVFVAGTTRSYRRC